MHTWGESIVARANRAQEAISATEVWLFDEHGQDLGFVSTAAAQTMAGERGLDLVRLDRMSSPPRYGFADAAVRQMEAARGARVAAAAAKPPKEIRLRVVTGGADVETRRRQAAALLIAGHRVKLRVELDPKKRSDPGPARVMIDSLIKTLAEAGQPDGKPFNEKGAVSVVLAPR
jgi:translation initiation factor IF-3